jgi:hypothetical protein
MVNPPKNQLDKLNDLSWNGRTALLRIFYENPYKKNNLLKISVFYACFVEKPEILLQELSDVN